MRSLVFEAIVHVSKSQVWQVIGTEAGIKSYMTTHMNVKVEVGGPYEALFDLSLPLGQQGSEGMKLLTVDPESRIGFTWNNPPVLKDIRDQLTAVYIELSEIEEGTLIQFHHVGFGNSDLWQQSYDYFFRAWGSIVLPRLVYVCENGPFPWGEEVDLSAFIPRVIAVRN